MTAALAALASSVFTLPDANLENLLRSDTKAPRVLGFDTQLAPALILPPGTPDTGQDPNVNFISATLTPGLADMLASLCLLARDPARNTERITNIANNPTIRAFARDLSSNLSLLRQPTPQPTQPQGK